jgi:hypothetical protein
MMSPSVAAARIGGASSWITKGIALFFACYALFACWTLFYRVTPAAIFSAAVCGVAAVGLWLKRPWSRWVVYFIATGICLYFVWYAWRLAYGDTGRSFASLVPVSILLAFGLASAVHVTKLFRRP